MVLSKHAKSGLGDKKSLNEQVLKDIETNRQLLQNIKNSRLCWLGHNMRHGCLLSGVLEGKIQEK